MALLRMVSSNGFLPPIIFMPEYHHVDEGSLRRRDVLPALENPVLELVDGTWRSQPAQTPGRMLDTFDLWSNQSRDAIRAAVNGLEAMLRLARTAQEGPDNAGEVYLEHITDDEFDTKSALIYSGSITITDAPLHLRTLETGPIRLTLEFERDEGWDMSTVVEQLWQTFEVHGGNKWLPPTNPATENMDSRISRMSISVAGDGFIKRIWAGIQPARRDLTYFNPQIRVDSAHVTLQPGGDTSRYPSGTDAGFHGGGGLICDWKHNSGWWPRFFCLMDDWNPDVSQSTAFGSPYIGEYSLLARMKFPNQSEVYGVRAVTRWHGTAEATFHPPVYIQGGTGAFPYYNLATINIGGTQWSSGMDGKLFPLWFVVGIHASALSGGLGAIYFDDMFIVPKKRSIYMNLPFEISAEHQVEIFGSANGITRAFISERADHDKLTTTTPKKLYAEVTDFSVTNWTAPAEGGRLVMVCDRGEEVTKSIGTFNRVQLELTRRTKHFVG